jgi:2-amino-4-hydroxy-6-hydroxymethyldihydropteridine diphosphokinase
MKSSKIKAYFVVLAIGSNLGKRQNHIIDAYNLMVNYGIIKSPRISSFYETEPTGIKNQPWFINAAISGMTNLSLNELMQTCKNIEYLIGRRKRKKWDKREIDIDILLYGDGLYETKNLTVPHKMMHERRFVLKPAAEIAGTAIHPKFRKTISQLLKDCNDMSEVHFAR